MKWSKWYLFSTGIRRYAVADKKKWQRLPKAKYKHLSEEELPAYVARLNHRYETQLAAAKAAYDFKHLFISQDLLDEFAALLRAEIPNENVHVSLYNYLKKHCLHWFINQMGLVDPIDWKLHERSWGLALLCKHEDKRLAIWSKPVHPDTISKHIQVLNRFLRFLNQRMPKEVPVVILEPLSKAQARLYKAEYESGESVGHLVTHDDWKTIERTIDVKIKELVQLAYYYGLRQAECLGELNLFEDSLEVVNQLDAYPGEAVYAPLKNRKTREVPHWFCEPKLTHRLLADRKLMHPDTFGQKFASEMARLKMPYGLHDLRRSFITRAFRDGMLPTDIRLAVGHVSLETTLRYAQDDRGLKRKRYVP